MSKFSKYDSVVISLGSGAEERDAIVLDSGSGITKVQWKYTDSNGKTKLADGWFKNNILKLKQ